MSVATAERRRMTVDEYFAFEESTEEKHELVNGEVVAMAGSSPRHGLISSNIAAALYPRIRNGPCRPVSSDVRVHVEESGLYTYPDVTVICGEPVTEPRGVAVTNPTVIFEVLSKSTEAYDRGAKFDHYRRCPSLREYVLVSQHERRVHHFRRVEEGWLLTEVADISSVRLPALGCELPLEELYDRAEQYPGDSD